MTAAARGTRRVALTREVSPRIAECVLTHLDRVAIDAGVARAQHAAYEQALRALGCDVRRVAPAPDLPDSVFIEDTAIVLEELAVICRPGARERRAETAAVAEALREYREVAELPRGTLDGGDVLRAARVLLVGVGARSSEEGVGALREIVAPHGYEVHAVAFTGCLHLKTAATLVADDVALVNPAWVDPAALAPLRVIAIDATEPFAANALRIGDALVHPAEFPSTRARLERAGLAVHPVPAAELAKAEGGVTCCSLVFDVAT